MGVPVTCAALPILSRHLVRSAVTPCAPKKHVGA